MNRFVDLGFEISKHVEVASKAREIFEKNGGERKLLNVTVYIADETSDQSLDLSEIVNYYRNYGFLQTNLVYAGERVADIVVTDNSVEENSGVIRSYVKKLTIKS